jgi:predicted nucleotidyltransferase
MRAPRADSLVSLSLMAEAQVIFVDGLWNGRSVRAWLPDVVSDVVRAVAPERLLVFGSVARGDDHAESDLDLLVILGSLDKPQRRDVMRKVRRAIEAPIPVDVMVTDVEEFEARRDLNGSPYYWPAREGEVVYERSA